MAGRAQETTWANVVPRLGILCLFPLRKGLKTAMVLFLKTSKSLSVSVGGLLRLNARKCEDPQ